MPKYSFGKFIPSVPKNQFYLIFWKNLLLAKKTILRPGETAADFMEPGAGSGGPLCVFLVCCAAGALFLYLKPVDFPADFSETAGEFAGRPWLWFFFTHTSLELAFTAAFCAFFPAFAALLHGGRPALKFLSGFAACGAYAAAAFYFKAEPLFALPFLAAAGAAAYAGIRAQKTAAAAFFRFSLAANAALLLCLPVSVIGTALRSETLFTAAEAAGGIWLMVMTIKAARAIFGATAARASLALMFSMAASVLSFYILKNIGLIPPAIFRFMMFM